MKTKHSRSLIALSTSALALPGIAHADAPPTESTLSYKISNYQEDDLTRAQVPFGELGRYDIDVHQFQYVSPLGRDFALFIDANHEDMSGASPWFSTANAAGEPVINMSGASGITDARSELSIGTRYYSQNGNFGGAVGYSEENDYRATYVNLSGSRNFNNDLTTVTLGFSHSADDIFPTDAELFNRVRNEDKRATSAAVSLSQVINRVTTFQTALSITEQSGYLSDPYKLQDARPDNKTQIALSNSLRYFFIEADGALQANYRYYRDDFGISSHTLDLSWFQNINRTFQIAPVLRYYSQSAAEFYTNIDDFTKPLTEPQSSDYRLSAFGAFSGGINLIADFGDWTTTFTAERYVANEKYSVYAVNQPSPALVQFVRLSLGVDYSF
ncbi:MAG: DUF3570 domain-containing protein [Pseudomonadales bacterium]|nr:DUF3570 domain-containing protein [Pseudomonadales bacterium]MBL6816579.1 DUF3570 domain-containing protein [Pseudomonadales bacterium]